MSSNALVRIVDAPDPEELRASAAPIVALANSILTIRSAEEYEAALVVIRNERLMERAIDDALEPTRRSLDEAKKALLALRNGLVKPVIESRVALGLRLEPWEQEQKRLAEEERRKKEEEIRAAEEARQIEEAAIAAEQGDAEALAEVETAEIAVPHVPTRSLPKVAGVSKREQWKAEVADLSALILWVAQDVEGRKFHLLPNEPMLNSIARGAKAEMNIPGVRAVCEVVRSVRG